MLIFPEGGRSRVGRVDTENFMYGVGRMLQEAPQARVLCVFARGVGQRVYSNYPKAGEAFVVRMKPIAPTTTVQGHAGGPRPGDADRPPPAATWSRSTLNTRPLDR